MWFNPRSLGGITPPAVHTRGLLVYLEQQVQAVAIQRVADGHWVVHGDVRGSQRQPYQTRVHVHLDAKGLNAVRWWGECTCPVGDDCKHGVALLLKAAHQGEALARAAAQAAGADDGASAVERQQRLQREAEQAAQAERLRRHEHLHRTAQHWLLGEHPQTPGHFHATREREQQRAERPIYFLGLAPHMEWPGTPNKLKVDLHAGSPKASGKGWNKTRAVLVEHFSEGHVYRRSRDVDVSAVDREVLSLLAALPPVGRSAYGVGPHSWWLDGVAAPLVLARMAQTGRLHWRESPSDPPGPAWTHGQPMPLAWDWQHQPDADDPDALPVWRLVHRLASSGCTLCVNHPVLWYVNPETQQVGPVEDPGGHAHQLLDAPPLPEILLRQHQPALLARLGNQVAPPPVLPKLLQVGGQPRWLLHVSRAPGDAPLAITAQLDFDYQGVQHWWPLSAPTDQVVVDGQGRHVHVHRDLASERAAAEQLAALQLFEVFEGLYAPPPAAETLWLDWDDDDYRPLKAAGFHVQVEPDLRQLVRHATALHADLQAPSSQDGMPIDEADPHPDEPSALSDWFELSLGLEVDGQRINVLPLLPPLLKRWQLTSGPLPLHLDVPDPSGQGFIRVNTETLKPWIHALLELFDDRPAGPHLRLSRWEAMRVGLGEGIAWAGAQALAQLTRQLQGQGELPVVPKPQGLNADLRPYQQQGLNWLQFLSAQGLAGILADDMGLGKTLQTLAHIQAEKEAGRLDRPALVVAPVSLMGNWQREAARFCPQLNTLVLHGTDRHDRADDMAAAHVVIAPYSLLHRDRERWLHQPWHLVVLDEAQNIKNAHTQAAQVVTELNTRHRLCLSGTPIENHLGEVWSLFHFLMPGFLGSQAKFQQRFRTPIEKHGDAERLAQLRARLTPFILRRTKQLVAHELPPKVESVMTVELGGKQADLYETIRLSMEKAVRDAIADKGLARSQIVFLDALLKLRQVCCDPRLVKTPSAAKVKTSAKLEQLMDMLPEMLAEGRRVLLFSQFTSMLSLIEDELKKAKIEWVKLTGQTQKRDQVIDRFTSGQVPVFLISLKAGGVGLNLPQADTVIHFDPWWNPAAEQQATDRAHRIGQTQSVWVIKLVAQGTIEERILALQARKAELANELYSGSTGRKQPLFTEDDVQALLKPLS